MCPRSNYEDLLSRWLEARKVWPEIHLLIPEPEPPRELSEYEAETIKAKAIHDHGRTG